MRYPQLSICYYPTTTILVDDNREFLETTSTELFVNKIACHFYDDPKLALNCANEHKQVTFVRRCVVDKEANAADRLTLDFDIRKIHQEIHNPKRFSEFSNLVADYSMPIMDGLQLCRGVKQDHVGKILLTGEAGQDLAVDAFNENVIDKFIMKGSTDYLNQLITSIRELERRYFLKLSDIVFRKITNTSMKVLACLSDLIFIEFFNKLCKENHVVEYYLLDWHGSFLMLDIQANPMWLIVKNEKEVNNLYEYARDEEAPPEVVDVLKNRKMIPYFHTEHDLDTPPEGWGRYMHPATELKGENQTYYYSFVKNTDLYKVDRGEILSFQDYLETLSYKF